MLSQTSSSVSFWTEQEVNVHSLSLSLYLSLYLSVHVCLRHSRVMNVYLRARCIIDKALTGVVHLPTGRFQPTLWCLCLLYTPWLLFFMSACMKCACLCLYMYFMLQVLKNAYFWFPSSQSPKKCTRVYCSTFQSVCVCLFMCVYTCDVSQRMRADRIFDRVEAHSHDSLLDGVQNTSEA